MKRLFLFLSILFAGNSFAQINYQPGYLVSNNGERQEVFIKNEGWRENPSTIEYRISAGASVQSASISDIAEFAIDDSYVFKRFTLDLDSSSDNVNNLSRTRNPEFVEQTVFLRLLVDGAVDLYQFTDGERNRFLFSVGDSEVEQLVHKQYELDKNRSRNNFFRQQLLNTWACGTDQQQKIETLDYSKNDLVSFIVDYNECLGEAYTVYPQTAVEAKGEFKFKVKAGLKMSSIQLERIGSLLTTGGTVDLESAGPQIGLEAEYRFPFNKQKWAVFIDPSYQQISAEQTYQYVPYDPSKTTTFRVEEKVLSVPLGIRHYFYLSDSSAIFVNAAYELTSFLNTTVDDSGEVFKDEAQVNTIAHGLQAGVGFSFLDKFSAEIKMSLPKDLLNEHSEANTSNFGRWEAKSSYISFILGYTLF